MDLSTQAARDFTAYVENLEIRMRTAFPNLFEDARGTMRQNIKTMNEILEASSRAH